MPNPGADGYRSADVGAGRPGLARVWYFPVAALVRRMSGTNASGGFNSSSANKISIVSTVIDAGIAFARGRRKSALLLLAAAALSSRIPGLGTATSILLRVINRLR
jgi:hypothetical protein